MCRVAWKFALPRNGKDKLRSKYWREVKPHNKKKHTLRSHRTGK